MYTWTLPNGTIIRESDLVKIDGPNARYFAKYTNPKAFFSPLHSMNYDRDDVVTIRFDDYNYGDDNNCHLFKKRDVTLLYAELQYDPTQQGDLDEDI